MSFHNCQNEPGKSSNSMGKPFRQRIYSTNLSGHKQADYTADLRHIRKCFPDLFKDEGYRVCLNCNKGFFSQGKANRSCNKCRQLREYKLQGFDEDFLFCEDDRPVIGHVYKQKRGLDP